MHTRIYTHTITCSTCTQQYAHIIMCSTRTHGYTHTITCSTCTQKYAHTIMCSTRIQENTHMHTHITCSTRTQEYTHIHTHKHTLPNASPCGCYAGNPLTIDLEDLITLGLLDKADAPKPVPVANIDFPKVCKT